MEIEKLKKQSVRKMHEHKIKTNWGTETPVLRSLKLGEGICFKIDKTYRMSFRGRWYEYARRNGIQVKTFITDDGLLVIERVK